MPDHSTIVKGQGTIVLGVPPLVKAATGEIVTAEEVGGADVHSRISGVTDHYALDDRHALGIARQIVGNLNSVKQMPFALAEPRESLYPAEEIYGVIPNDVRRSYDARDILART